MQKLIETFILDLNGWETYVGRLYVGELQNLAPLGSLTQIPLGVVQARAVAVKVGQRCALGNAAIPKKLSAALLELCRGGKDGGGEDRCGKDEGLHFDNGGDCTV